MTKIIGIDLGTNSIGWAIRELESDKDNQIIDYGVNIFETGMGNKKGSEYSRAAERRSHRSKRRLYNAKRYRKWELLKVLIENDMCPLDKNDKKNKIELKIWSIGDWKNFKKNKGRKYPTNPDFLAWLAMDFEKIGIEHIKEEKLKPAYINPYDLRCELIEQLDESNKFRLYKIGRALYHLVQRRGFKTSRKNGKNEDLNKIKDSFPELKYSVQILRKGLNEEKKRIRASGVLQRVEYENEFYAICGKQKISNDLIEKLYKAIYFVRPLRTQKGLVGKCTLEKGKPRIPISHPLFEEFRALSFINNIQRRETESKKSFEPISIQLKKQILENLFFRKIEKGKNKGKYDDRTFFKFEEIIDSFSENGKYEFNYRNKPNVSTCPVIAGLMNVFDKEWENKFISDEKQFGINWNGLNLQYFVQYGKKIGQSRNLRFEEIWHLIFDYIQIKDKEEDLKLFCKNVLSWNNEKITEFVEIGIQQGYGSLSSNAIRKIIPFFQEGYIYSEAVSFANLAKVLGKEKFSQNKSNVTITIANAINTVAFDKERLNIVNGLIQQFFALNETNRSKGLDDVLWRQANIDVEKKLKMYFGESNWNEKTEEERKTYLDFVLEKYLKFLDGEQTQDEKASADKSVKDRVDYYKLPRLDEAIKEALKKNFQVTNESLKHLYHPSDIDIYPKSKNNCLENPQPPSKAWKNPMAMRTMHELKKLINYLLENGKIDSDTKIVVELARELNDANKRWAIQTYQKRREDQNIEFAKAIIGIAKEKYPNLNENDADNVDKVRLWWEQIDNGEELYKEIKALKEDIQKYRLWHEQGCLCMYTGKIIKLVDLFDGTKTQFEHTLPLSDSFDNSLANLTVCDAEYNMNIKKNQFPTQLRNYEKEWNGFSAIEPRLKKWIDKRNALKEQIDNNKIETKSAIRKGDVERKNYLIRERHLKQFEFDYWLKKLKTFTLIELPESWKNSQLVDTQIITKYARAYLKTVFNRVDVQKGTITAEFRKIYGIMGDEKKDRSKHCHHAIDASVLTLIPGSARREEILRKYYEAIERNEKYHEPPYIKFNITHITDIEKKVLINHVTNDRTLTPTFKKMRKRGKVQFLKDCIGNKKPIFTKGDSIRGQLHKETFFGAIKANERNNEGFAIKDEQGNFKIKQNNGKDEIWIVAKKPITDLKVITKDGKKIISDIIVDEVLKNRIENQINNGIDLSDITSFANNKIRHIRCRVKAGIGVLSAEKPLLIKKHVFLSKYLHKQNYLSQNEENYLFLLYEGVNEKNNKTVRSFKILNLFDIGRLAQFGLLKISEIKEESGFFTILKNNIELKIKIILKVGDRVIFYKKDKEEITDYNAKDRLFQIFKFNEPAPGTAWIYLVNPIEAGATVKIKKGDKEFNPEKYQDRLDFTCDKMNCLFEHKDFEIKPDGKIEWKF